MAILSFAVLAILGVMPGGLANLQAAEQREAEARIYQSLVAEYQTKPWQELRLLTRSEVLYFDNTGLALTHPSDTVAYAAVVERVTKRMLLPGETNPSPYLMHLIIAISDRLAQGGGGWMPYRPPAVLGCLFPAPVSHAGLR